MPAFSDEDYIRVNNIARFMKNEMTRAKIISSNDRRFPFGYYCNLIRNQIGASEIYKDRIFKEFVKWGAKHGSDAFICEAIRGACEYLSIVARNERREIKIPEIVNNLVAQGLASIGNNEKFKFRNISPIGANDHHPEFRPAMSA